MGFSLGKGENGLAGGVAVADDLRSVGMELLGWQCGNHTLASSTPQPIRPMRLSETLPFARSPFSDTSIVPIIVMSR